MTPLRAKWTNLDAWHVHEPFCLKKHARTIRDFSSSHKTFSNRTLRMIFVSIHMRRHLNIFRYFQWKVRYFANCDFKIPRNERALEVLVYLLGKVISIKLFYRKFHCSRRHENLICLDRLVTKCIPLMIYLLNPFGEEFHLSHFEVLIKTVRN